MENPTANVILRTKLTTPHLWREFVSRPRLINALNEGLARRLTLVTAPAGYGKTTILSEWANQINPPAAWLTLDEGDNDLTRFLTYVTVALQTINEEITTRALEGLHPSAVPPAESILSQLINEITLAAEPLVLILDDYQVIEFQPIHEAVSFLVEHLPAQMQVVLSSRIDPPLPFARWRGRGQLAELREADLRFTAAETGVLHHVLEGVLVRMHADGLCQISIAVFIPGDQFTYFRQQAERIQIVDFFQGFYGWL